MDFSIVIPALNESKKIARDVNMASMFLDANGFRGEVIVVDDGSSDGTGEIAGQVKVARSVELKVIRCERQGGKGSAVRTGMKQTHGEYAMFADSGCCVPYGNALLGLEMLKEGTCEIAHGSRKLIESDIQQSQPWRRRTCSKVFKWLVHALLRLPAGLTDTQCGFKVYKGDVARELYGECVADGFMFDVEIILRAQRSGYRIREFPIEWTCDLDSRLSMTRTPWPVIRELIAIKRTLSK